MVVAAMAALVAAMAALAAAVTAALAALHLQIIWSHHSTDPRTAENALIHPYIFPGYHQIVTTRVHDSKQNHEVKFATQEPLRATAHAGEL